MLVRVTQWHPADMGVADSGFVPKGTRITYAQWCELEAARIERNGRRSCIRTIRGECAVYASNGRGRRGCEESFERE